jgi:hypothetical protein
VLGQLGRLFVGTRVPGPSCYCNRPSLDAPHIAPRPNRRPRFAYRFRGRSDPRFVASQGE